MYEIWLMMNIAWETALAIWPWLLGAGVVWLMLVMVALRRPGAGWRRRLPAALVIAALAAVGAFVALPGGIGSSVRELAYWVDWMTLLGLAGAAGGLVAAFAWPVLALRGAR